MLRTVTGEGNKAMTTDAERAKALEILNNTTYPPEMDWYVNTLRAALAPAQAAPMPDEVREACAYARKYIWKRRKSPFFENMDRVIAAAEESTELRARIAELEKRLEGR